MGTTFLWCLTSFPVSESTVYCLKVINGNNCAISYKLVILTLVSLGKTVLKKSNSLITVYFSCSSTDYYWSSNSLVWSKSRRNSFRLSKERVNGSNSIY